MLQKNRCDHFTHHFHAIGHHYSSTSQDNIFDLLRRLTVSVHPASRSGCFGWCACVTDKERNERDETRTRNALGHLLRYTKTIRCRQLPMCDCVLSTLHTQLLPSSPHNALEEYRVICARKRRQYCSNEEDYYREGRRA